MMPVFGKWVVDLLRRGEQPQTRWQWKSNDGTSKKWGNDVSWRVGDARELSELIEEKDRLERARL